VKERCEPEDIAAGIIEYSEKKSGRLSVLTMSEAMEGDAWKKIWKDDLITWELGLEDLTALMNAQGADCILIKIEGKDETQVTIHTILHDSPLVRTHYGGS
jgi:hypothetical protein